MEWQNAAPEAHGAFVFYEKDELYARIDRRVEEMFRAGVIEEVAKVKELSATAAKTLGLVEIEELLAGKTDRASCIAAIQQSTRRYAKRQLTWFRRQSNFEPLNLSFLKDHESAVDWLLQKAERAFASAE
jgi:tRNA dimethylallyltransferase